jgi:hypothetical protein
MPEQGISFAGTSIEIDGVVVAKITKFEKTTTITSEAVTGSEDVVGTAPNKVQREKRKPVSVGETASIEGIYVTGDQGQSDLEDAAKNGDEIVVRQLKQDGQGRLMTGFLEEYKESGAMNGIYTFSSNFFINSETAVNGSAS